MGREEAKSLIDIEQALGTATLMRHPDLAKLFIINCDASITGLGVALHQHDGHGKEYPVAFASRTLRPNERKWTTTKLKARAVVWAMEAFLIYVEDFCIIIRTDHSPLLWLRKNVGNSVCLAGWVLRLQDFTLQLLHCPGTENPVADAQ